MGQAEAKKTVMPLSDQHKHLLIQATVRGLEVVQLEEQIENQQKDLAALKRQHLGALRQVAQFEEHYRAQLQPPDEEQDKEEVQTLKVPKEEIPTET